MLTFKHTSHVKGGHRSLFSYTKKENKNKKGDIMANIFCAYVPMRTPGKQFTTSPLFSLWNPSSAVNLKILKVTAALTKEYNYDAWNTCALVYGYVEGQTSAPINGEAISSRSTLLGSGANSQGSCYSKSTLKSVPIGLEPAFSIGTTLANGNISVANSSLIDYVNGQIIVPQNSVFTIQGINGADVLGVQLSVFWEEAPVGV
jgi:hypothetical protein